MDIIKDVLENEMGFRVSTKPITANEVDVKVSHNNELLAVMEVQNWKRTSYFNLVKGTRALNILRQYDCLRLLVVSFEENVFNTPRDFVENLVFLNVRIISMGYQVMPINYYQMYQESDPEIIKDMKLPDDPLVKKTAIKKFEFLQKLTT
ncbi:MAG: hypothetical protein ACFFDS_10540 [Candidatus Thorarchaeota archaeon]